VHIGIDALLSYDAGMARTRTTLSIDAAVMRSTRIAAARSGKHDSEIVEAALRSYLGLDVIDRIRAGSDLSAEDAERLAYAEVHASRKH
jgi:hypothetical protein